MKTGSTPGLSAIPRSSPALPRILFRRHPRARRYRISVRPDQIAVTIPSRGNLKSAHAFLIAQTDWIWRTLERLKIQPGLHTWPEGSEILFRGERVRVASTEQDGKLAVRFGPELCFAASGTNDFRALIEARMKKLALLELPARVLELAKVHSSPVRKVSVRNQRTRWGSCSAGGTVSLNWRLIQLPCSVRDYIILHELMHLREMNHSPRFWAQVRTVCPEYPSAQAWLRDHRSLLRC